jgi:hypothetical protein
MSDNWADSWLTGATWHDRQQNRRIEGLESDLSNVSSSLSSARSSQKRLQAELSKVSGTLEQRITKLSAAFDAFVEISDLRVTLGLFDAQAMVRHQARQLFARTPVSGEVSDVEAYWLPPALTVLRVAADGVLDTEALEVAMTRDARRSAVLYVLGTAVLGGRETVTAELLAETMPPFEATIPRHHRAVWTLAADGFFGEAGWELARRRGVEFVRGLDASAKTATLDELRSIAGRSETIAVPRELEGASDLASVLGAAGRLAALREWVAKGVTGRTNEPAAEADPLVTETVTLLVDEGSPVELPLMARERELRKVIEGAGAEAPAWDGSVGDTLALLHADLTDDTRPDRRVLAVRVCGEHLVSVAEEFASVARRPAPTRLPARTRFGQVMVGATGVESDSLAKAEQRLVQTFEPDRRHRRTAYIAAGFGVAFLVAMFAGWGWVIPALGAAGAVVAAWRMDTAQVKKAEEDARHARAGLHTDVEQRVTAFARLRTDLTREQSDVDLHLTEIRKLLA